MNFPINSDYVLLNIFCNYKNWGSKLIINCNKYWFSAQTEQNSLMFHYLKFVQLSNLKTLSKVACHYLK